MSILLNPKTETYDHLDAPSREIMRQTIAFFEDKGKRQLKEDDHERRWYTDFLDFVREKRIFATLLTPPEHAAGNPDARWDTCRNVAFNEILGFYSLAHWYAWQVTILGLGPLWMSGNQAIKAETARRLREGGVFGFGLSEKAHGADLYSSEMMLTPMGGGNYRADGGKYYIGNGNVAALLSVFGKNSDNDEYVWFAVDPQHAAYECVQNVVNSQMYVSEFALHGYPLTDAEILSTGQEAWDAALNTVNVGKYNLGWASIGIGTHAFHEAVTHAAHRNLYGKFVTDFPHIRQLFADAYARLAAMKLFATRASDYLRTASLTDRRYLLYNPLVKMKVTTEGEHVINHLWDIIAARGFEKDTYFEAAARDIRALPKLEGTVHVNMALVVKFMANYLFNPGTFPEIGRETAPRHDAFLFAQGPTRGLGKIQFHDYRLAYDSLELPNLAVFREQIEALKAMLLAAPPTKEQSQDIGLLLSLGELFTLVAYGQLIIENTHLLKVDHHLVNLIFDVMVRDFSRFALQIYSHPGSSAAQMAHCLKLIRKPAADPDGFRAVWEGHIRPLVDGYAMNP